MPDPNSPGSEVRIGLVLYGGVSLCVYMNGVVQEFLHLVKSTSREAQNDSPIQNVYRKLGRMIASHDPDSSTTPTRFLIDAIAGTSAGGINGVFLAKALALNTTLDQIKRLWVEEGDIAKLLNDTGSMVDELARYDLQQPPASLLNSQRMYVKLIQALGAMKPGPGPALAGEIDLHITATDLRGLVLPIQLSDGRVFERRHKTEFHFRYSDIDLLPAGGHTNQFTAAYDPFLAFAARCTSSFPVAFEPMLFSDIDDALHREGILLRDPAAVSSSARWQSFYPSYTPQALAATGRPQLDFPRRPFADGGYLDNKPFSFVIDEIVKRQGPLPIDRKLFYLEPAPDSPENDKIDPRRPNAIANAWLALSSLPRYETIRGDLDRARDRNREIDRLRRLLASIEAAAPALPAPEYDGVQWRDKSSFDLARDYGPGYTTYHCVKISSVTDDFTALLYRHFAIDRGSLLAHRLRALIEAWRDKTYGRPESREDTLNHFLLDFDTRYRLRRFQHLFRTLDIACSSEMAPRVARARRLRAALIKPYEDLLRLQRAPHTEALNLLGSCENLRETLELEASHAEVSQAAASEGLSHSPSSAAYEYERAQRILGKPGVEPAIKAAVDELRKEFAAALKAIRDAIDQALVCEDAEDQAAIALCNEIKDASDHFERHDMLTFPLLFNTPIGEMDEIEIYRISPMDAPIGARHTGGKIKVKGAALGAFAGFLEREWRENDILWGRLDGAERILSALLPAATAPELRESLIAEAHLAIVTEDLANHPKLQGLGLTGADLLRKWMELRMEEQQRRPWAETLARGTTVIGQLLDGTARARKIDNKLTSAITVAGRLAWGLVEVATPRAFPELVFRYWLFVFFASGVLLVLAGFLIPGLQAPGWTLIALTAGFKAAAMCLQDYFQTIQQTHKQLACLALALLLPAVVLFSYVGLRYAPSAPLAPHYNLFFALLAAFASLATLAAAVYTARVSGKLPIARIQCWATVADVRRDLASGPDLPHPVKTLFAHLDADRLLVAAYSLLFLALGAVVLRAGDPFFGLAIAILGSAAALADIGENERIIRNASTPLLELGNGDPNSSAPLDLPVAPASRSKWIFFFGALAPAAFWLLRQSSPYHLARIAGAAVALSILSRLAGLLLRKEREQFNLFALALLLPALLALAAFLALLPFA